MSNIKTVILGIGNTLKGDDGVGPYIINELRNCHCEEFAGKSVIARTPSEARGTKQSPPQKTDLIDAGTVPENYMQAIIQKRPEKLIIIDAIDFGGRPGEVKEFKQLQSANISISTHNLPPELFIDFIVQQAGAAVTIIAIQPKSIKFNEPLSAAVKQSADKLITELQKK